MASEALKNRTKTLLTQALRELMQTKKLDTITIADIVNKCGVSRRAFYYHFADVYDAVWWTFEADLKELFRIDDPDWRQNLLELLDYFSENRAFCMSVLSSSQHIRMETQFFNRIKESALVFIKQQDQAHTMSPEDMDILASLSARMVVSALGGWVHGIIRCEKERLPELLYNMIEAGVERVLAEGM